MEVYRNFNASQCEDLCGICRESLKGSDAVAHTGNGDLHPFHRECVKSWVVFKNTCAACNVNTYTSSLFTWEEKCIIWKDKCIQELASIARDASLGMQFASFVSLPFVYACKGIAFAGAQVAATAAVNYLRDLDQMQPLDFCLASCGGFGALIGTSFQNNILIADGADFIRLTSTYIPPERLVVKTPEEFLYSLFASTLAGGIGGAVIGGFIGRRITSIPSLYEFLTDIL